MSLQYPSLPAHKVTVRISSKLHKKLLGKINFSSPKELLNFLHGDAENGRP